MRPTELESPSRSHAATVGWRRLPLTAQLLVVGMLVGLTWFLVTRAAGDRQRADARARTERLRGLQRDEVAATRLGTSLVEMRRAHLALLLTGDPRYVDVETLARLEVESEVAQLRASASGGRLAPDLEALTGATQRWHDSTFLADVARSRERAARSPGVRTPGVRTPASVSDDRGEDLLDRAVAAQHAALRAIREDVGAVTLLLENEETRDEWESFVLWSAALAVFLLVLTLLMHVVGRALAQVVTAARALDAGRYREARLPDAQRAPNLELAQLASSFEQLAASMEHRERQLQQDLERQKELERLKSDFVSTVSHELRTPLTSMRGAIGLILGGKVGDVTGRGQDLLKIAMTNTERLIRLINDILDLEKMDAGHVAIRGDRLRVRPLVETTLAGLEGFAREKGVTLRLLTPDDAEIVGDSDRLIQVLTNLVSNAVKFSPTDRDVELEIAAAGGHVRVAVRDHGPGIPDEFAKRIFGRFQQAGGAESRRSGGTGLGLNIARNIVELHDGEIGFGPAEGGGTTFWISLPVVAPLAPARDMRRAVLIVEGDATMRDVLVAMVEGLCRPIPVQSAEAALELLGREPVAAIVLDPGLAGMNGLAFAGQLRKDSRHRTLPVFLFSAREYSAEELRAAGIRAADAYVKTRDSETVLYERIKHELQKSG